MVRFHDMPATSRLWIYPCDRPLSKDEAAVLEQEMTSFVKQWAAHRRDLTAVWELKYNQFVMIAVDESRMVASGCSIDSLVHQLGQLESKLGVNIIGNASKVFFRDGEAIRCVLRPEFKKLVADGQVHPRTIIFNNIVQTLAELESWEVPLADSWHARAFALQTA